MVDLVGCGAPGPVGFGTEGGLYSDRLGVPSVIVGPGDIADAHRPNETVAPDQLEQCGDVLRRTITASVPTTARPRAGSPQSTIPAKGDLPHEYHY
ncbi:MAG: hypothetical protein CM1200mP26_19180 [Acidimicrobiales bacterium]|nr:MAG: hypothetical protein CM1200mP26_19180 [Acidimicrobiales bacterium]